MFRVFKRIEKPNTEKPNIVNGHCWHAEWGEYSGRMPICYRCCRCNIRLFSSAKPLPGHGQHVPLSGAGRWFDFWSVPKCTAQLQPEQKGE